jgi:hypothetical protein
MCGGPVHLQRSTPVGGWHEMTKRASNRRRRWPTISMGGAHPTLAGAELHGRPRLLAASLFALGYFTSGCQGSKTEPIATASPSRFISLPTLHFLQLLAWLGFAGMAGSALGSEAVWRHSIPGSPASQSQDAMPMQAIVGCTFLLAEAWQVD